MKGFKGDRATFLGELDGQRSLRISALAEQLGDAGLRVVVPDSIGSVLWTKQVSWIPLVVLPTLTRLTWGEAFAQRDLAAVYVKIERECAQVATAYGNPPQNFPGLEVSLRLNLPFEEAVENVLEMGRRFVAEGNGAHEVAMLLDFKRRRRTEADNTIGVMLEKAQQANISVPYTECAWRLVRSIEATF